MQTLRRSIAASLAALWPIVALALDRIAQKLLNSPDIVLLLFILILLLVTIQILNFTRRVVVSLTRFAFNLVFYAGVVGLVAFMYQRGLEASVRDSIVFGARLWGYAVGVKDVFLREWERYSEEEKMRVRTGTGTGGGGARGW